MNPVVEWQLIVPNPDAVAEFYAKAFGWTVTTQNALGYRRVGTGEGGTPGGIWPASLGRPGFVQLFIRVADVEQAIETARALGATVVIPRTVLPDGDTMAVLQDPAGISFGLVAQVAAPRGEDSRG